MLLPPPFVYCSERPITRPSVRAAARLQIEVVGHVDNLPVRPEVPFLDLPASVDDQKLDFSTFSKPLIV